MSVQVKQRQKKEKHHFCGARCYDTFVGAYRECGILPGEESERKTVDNYFSRSDVPRCEQNEEGLPCEVMRHKSGRGKFAISATSVIMSNSTPSGKQVRECGARVDNNALISRSVQTSRYISALPQYLERFAARYTNPLRHNNFCKSAPTEKRKWVRGRAKHEQKETGTH